ncbi:MAG: ABC transporter [Anaerolineaceae bacterium 4572_32.2]|nr:MAG: ABC transporter [Anaerolineaceae bacterium 4572_32.2]HEY74505.1 ABC transporter ATP-binding protein [Thermoflexia bacterium]
MSASIEFDFKNTVSDNRLLGLWRMMTGFRWLYLGAVGGVGVAAVFRMGVYLLLRYFVDDVLSQKHFGVLPLVGLGFVGLALAQGVFTFLSGRWAAQTAEGVTLRLRNYLYDHIQRLSFTYHDQTKTGELIQRATSDVEAVRLFFADQAIGAGRILLLFAVNFVALLSLNTRLALLSVLVVPLVVIMSLFFFKRISQAYEKFQEQEAKLSTTLQENLTGVRVVKAFARQPYERDKFEHDNWEQFRRGRRLLTMHSLFWPISDILCGGQMLGGFFAGALMAINGAITVGDYLAYTGLVVWLIWPMRNLGRLIVHMSAGMVSYGRVTKLIKENREPLEEGRYKPSGNVDGEIVFRDVCFEYDGAGSVVLRDISFRCEPGQAVALLGSTGSGKTSLVNLLPRFYEYNGGSLTLDGVELKEYARHYLRRQIGIVEQEPFLFSRTIRENITYGVGRTVSDEEVEAAAQSAAIHDVILSFPDGYDTLVGERGVTLSGGQKQRVAVARTLLKDPRILILDDATSSVDTGTEGEIRAALEYLMQGRSTFIVAHRIQSVMNADLILVLDQGRIVQRGTHEELMAQEGVYRQIYDMQARIEGELEQEMDYVTLEV